MQVILLEKVGNLGNLGDVVNVKDGFGRNFLIPHGKAKRATEANKAEFESRRADLEKQQAALLAAAQKRVKALFILKKKYFDFVSLSLVSPSLKVPN